MNIMDFMPKRCEQIKDKLKQKPRTNFDRITESVESLARYIENYTMFWWKKCDQCETYDHCNECIKEWLKKEIEE